MVFEVKTETMCRTFLQLLILVSLSCLSWGEDEAEVTVSCPAYQKAFAGSCYEFVAHQRSFFSAQAWCKESGGHLAFIPDEDTQYFLQGHLDPEVDTWLGVARSASPNLTYSGTTEGKKGEMWNTVNCYCVLVINRYT